MSRRAPAFPYAALLPLLLAACTGTTGESAATDEATASTTANQSPAASDSVPASASDGGGGAEGELCAVQSETCPLEAGTYSVAPFEPAFTLTVDDGWTNDRAWPDGGGVSKDEGGFYWASGVGAGTVGSEEVEIGASVDEFVAFLSSLEAIGMTVSEPTEVTVDDAAGQQVDVESNDVEAFGLFSLDNDQFNLVPNEKARFLVVERDGETVVFIIDAFTTDSFDSWVETAQQVVDSVSWVE